MLLLTGAPGSGKTRFCLDQLRQSLVSGNHSCRLLTPTTTMAEHLRNDLAREGFVFSPRAISTFGKFVSDFVPDIQQVSSAALELIVGDLLVDLPPGRYRGVSEFPGFRKALARVVEEFFGAGGTAEHLGLTDPDFTAICSAVRDAVAKRNEVFRAERLRRAAERIRTGPELGKIWIAGFFGFTQPEMDVLEAFDSRSELVITKPERAGSFPRGESRVLNPGPVAAAPRVLFTAPTAEAEATEIARRIVTEHQSGRPFREMGVIVRSEQPSVPALRAAFERFGIPYRAGFSIPLKSEATVRYLMGLVRAALSGWKHEETLPVLRMHGSPLESYGDHFEYQVLDGLLSNGLDGLRAYAPAFAADYFDGLSALSSWATDLLSPAKWAERFAALPSLFRAARIEDGVEIERTLIWRTQNAALNYFAAAVEETAVSLDGPVGCQAFADALDIVLLTLSIRLVDRRHEVVNIIDAMEARQWRIPVVFVCGLLEQQFPKQHSEDPILDDNVRRSLQRAGLAVRTSVERQADEEALFDTCLTRATAKLFLSYPKLNAKGEPNLPSFFLARAEPYATEVSSPVKPPPTRERAPEPHAAIVNESLREVVGKKHPTLSASKIESFLGCPYSFFALKTLKLREWPKKPWDRLTTGHQGTIGHKVFELVFREGADITAVFNAEFERACEQHKVPDGYRTESIRLELLHGIEKLIGDPRLRPHKGLAKFEEPFDINLGDTVRIRGQIDRLEIDSAHNAVIFDYKYKRQARIQANVRENDTGRRVQTGLYLMAAQSFGYQPAGMVYSGFKRESSVGGWVLHGLRPELKAACSPEHIEELMMRATEITLQVHADVLNGRIQPQPAELRECEFCSCSTICRIEKIAEPMTGTADAAQ